jgi:hypothetical protein
MRRLCFRRSAPWLITSWQEAIAPKGVLARNQGATARAYWLS